MKKVVVIGGGTGTFVVLTALRDYSVELSAVVSMADNGGSTGRLRDQYGVLPPGDIRRALVALSDTSQTLRSLFNYRFSSGDLRGHNFGNIFLSALEKITGNFGDAVKLGSEILNIKGSVIPVTLDNTTLHAQLASDAVVRGETNIDIPKHDPTVPIKKVWLDPPAHINSEAIKAILAADMIVIGPGDLYTSIIPNLLVEGMAAAIKNSKARKVYICNLMTKFGETHGFKAQDFVNTVEKYLSRGILDYAVFNNKKPSASVLKRYLKENSHFVEISGLRDNGRKPKFISANLLDIGNFVRHNPKKKLAKILISLLN
ncbi:MAG: YvcK family protein [Candidatus Yanofskybacteria bacterium]|nr:YvcK family protein [Candidatus Yanofskybacteria bacterium]